MKTLTERAGLYLATMDASVSGAGGHTAAFKAAVALVQGFGLDEAAALGLMLNEFNPRCQPAWSERELRHKIQQALTNGKPPEGKARGWLAEVGKHRTSNVQHGTSNGVMAKPERPVERAPAGYDEAAMARVFRPAWGKRRALIDASPVHPDSCGPGKFLAYLYEPSERVLIFTRYQSQGDFLYTKRKFWRLADQPGVRAVESPLQHSTPDGVWFLPQPVTGQWAPLENGKLSRRHKGTVTAWPWMLLECDPPAEDQERIEPLWLSVLAQLPLPIAAIYTSGGRSVHALVKVPGIRTKADWDRMKGLLGRPLAAYGADYRALSAVRLTRLPGCLRGGQKQQLLYLNPSPAWPPVPICEGGFSGNGGSGNRE